MNQNLQLSNQVLIYNIILVCLLVSQKLVINCIKIIQFINRIIDMIQEKGMAQSLLPKQHYEEQVQDTDISVNPKHRKIKDQYFSKKRYLYGSNIFQTLFFTWISPLLKLGFRFSLDEKSIPYLKEEDRPKVDFNRLQTSWDKTSTQNRSKTKGWTLVKSMMKGFRKEFILVFIFAFILAALQMYLPILSYGVIQFIEDRGEQKQLGTGLAYFFGIFGVTLVLTINATFLWYYFAILGFNLSNTLRLLLYNKSMKHPLLTEKQFSVSDIVNYSQVDAQRMTYMGFQLVSVLYAPIQILVGFFLLYSYIGISFLVGLGVMIALMLFTVVFSKIASKKNDELLKAKDARMKVAEEILQIIKFIKVNTLQKYFFKKIDNKRQTELRLIRNVNLLNVMTIIIYWLCPPMIVAFTFLIYLHLGNTITAAKAFFTIIIFNILQSPIRQLPGAISQLIQMWSSVKRIQNFLLSAEISDDFIEHHKEPGQIYAIQIERGNFLWGRQKQKQKNKDGKSQTSDKQKNKTNNNSNKKNTKDSNTEKTQQSEVMISSVASSLSGSGQLNRQSISSQNTLPKSKSKSKQKNQSQQYSIALQNVDIKFSAREVTMIIGDIGSGKSSLLYAILNEMTPSPDKNPRIKINGSIAYSPQKAWIMTGTVKQNIVFFQPFNEKRLKDAIYYACLEDDLKILNKGIDTEIGEKGVNLSGGQKARISLARALYSNKDIYLLDDILSAVDVHVGKFLMEETILKYLRDKTVIMPTHAVKYLDRADKIIIMKKGKVIANGRYKEVSDCEEFQQINQFLNKKQQQRQSAKLSKQEEQAFKQLKQVKQVVSRKQKRKKQVVTQTEEVTDKIVDELILPQDRKKGEVQTEVYMEYIRLNGGAIFVISIIFFMCAWTVLSVLSNIQIERWCQDEGQSPTYLYMYLGFAVAATILSGARAYVLITSGIRQGRTIHKKVIKALLYASITKFYNRVPIGRILNRLSKDLRDIDQVICYQVGDTLICLFSMLASMTMCLYASTPFLFIPIVIVGIICRRFLIYYLKSERECVRLEHISVSPIVSGFTAAVNGVATIRAYNLPTQFLNHQITKVDVSKRMRVARQAMQSWFVLRLTIMSFFINMSALAYCIIYNNDPSLAGLLLTYSGMLNDDIIKFAFSCADLELKMIAIERVSTFAKLQPEPGYAQYCQSWSTREEGTDINAITQAKVQFKNYSARYRDGLPLVINNVSLTIEKGEKIGIVGRTGAGKTTLINGLLRIIQPAGGSIFIDGKQMRDYNLKDLRSCITMIQQQPTLMNGSFRQNLDPGRQYTDAQIEQILKQCNLADLVQSKGGLDAQVTNQNLSVGEKQLMCICRAFLKKSPLVLLDQATANIDVKNDNNIQLVIAKAFKNSTVLTIAHRLTTLENCDKIIVLGDGKLVEWGNIKQLMKKPDGIYKKMMEEHDKSYLK